MKKRAHHQFNIDFGSPELRAAGQALLTQLGFDEMARDASEAAILLREAMRVERLVSCYHGAGLSAELERPFQHLAAFERRDDARRMCAKLNKEGYTDASIARLKDSDGKTHFFLTFGHSGKLATDDLAPHTVKLARTAYYCGGEYDGWQFPTTSVEAQLVRAAMEKGMEMEIPGMQSIH